MQCPPDFFMKLIFHFLQEKRFPDEVSISRKCSYQDKYHIISYLPIYWGCLIIWFLYWGQYGSSKQKYTKARTRNKLIGHTGLIWSEWGMEKIFTGVHELTGEDAPFFVFSSSVRARFGRTAAVHAWSAHRHLHLTMSKTHFILSLKPPSLWWLICWLIDWRTAGWWLGIGVGDEGEAGQSEDICAVFAAASTTALVAMLDVTQNLQDTVHPVTLIL